MHSGCILIPQRYKKGGGCTSVRRTCSIGIGATRSSHSCLGVAAAVYQQKYNTGWNILCPLCFSSTYWHIGFFLLLSPFQKAWDPDKKGDGPWWFTDSQAELWSCQKLCEKRKSDCWREGHSAILSPRSLCPNGSIGREANWFLKGLWLYQGKKEGEFNLLFYAINARNKDAVSIILPRSSVGWQNSSGIFSSRQDVC